MGERQNFSAEGKREIVTMADSQGRPGFIFWLVVRYSEMSGRSASMGREPGHESRS